MKQQQFYSNWQLENVSVAKGAWRYLVILERLLRTLICQRQSPVKQ